MQDAVTGAHETSTEFSEEILKEHNIFELSKQAEMKDMMGGYADGQIEMYEKVGRRLRLSLVCDVLNLVGFLKQAIEDWDRVIPLLSKIKVDI